jgi:hypothetical protein
MRRNKILQYILFGLAFVVLPILRGEWNLSLLCDGFSLAGILLLSYGGLQLLNAERAFDGIFYIGTRIKSLLFPFQRKGTLSYYEYKRQKQTKADSIATRKEKGTAYSALLIGAGYFFFAVLLLFFL